jgi:NAD(P)-dependent dehydrogenase (short-subunit alcohol dehydrogenase family)
MAGAFIIGAGPGIGRSVARRFARAGLPVAVVARNPETVEATARAVQADGGTALALAADSTDEQALRAALDTAVETHGAPEVLVYNAANIRSDVAGELTAAEHLQAWAVNVVGAVTAAGHLGPQMVDNGGGTIILTGGMPEPMPQLVSLSLGKAGIRALATMLDKQLGPEGVHVATVTVCGVVEPGGPYDPDLIAERYWQIHAQPAGSWEREVLFQGG